MRSKTLEGPWHERHPLQVIIPPGLGAAFDSTWTGWPRAWVDETKGEVQVLYAAGANDMKTSKMHPYATTGLRRWNLTEMAQWALPAQK